jgi:hypothetical protein
MKGSMFLMNILVMMSSNIILYFITMKTGSMMQRLALSEDITQKFDQEQPLVEAHEEIVYTYPEVNQQSSMDQQPPMSILLPLVPIVYIKQLEVEKEICYQSHVFCHHFYDPVGVYMEL